jgi:hypothetical protein
MKKLSLFFLLIAFATTSRARLGETPAQCAQRYGTPGAQSTADTLYFNKAGFLIAVHFFQGKADYLFFVKQKCNALKIPDEISENELELFMQANGSGKKWIKSEALSINSEWHTDDGTLWAYYRQFDHQLMVSTKSYIERLEAETKDEETKTLQGF